MRNKRSVWTVNTKPYKGSHFAVYPEELIIPCILAGSREGDVVFDPFMGSGTTAAVSLKLGRNYLGCELNPDYVTLQEKRIKEAKESLGFDGPVTTSEKAQHWVSLFNDE
jgi:DNA modification methylase